MPFSFISDNVFEELTAKIEFEDKLPTPRLLILKKEWEAVKNSVQTHLKEGKNAKQEKIALSSNSKYKELKINISFNTHILAAQQLRLRKEWEFTRGRVNRLLRSMTQANKKIKQEIKK